MVKPQKSKEARRRDKEVVQKYHQKVTEEELEPLFKNFLEWKAGKMPYYELTECIHEFHKKNQKIWTMFNYNGSNDEFLIFLAKRDLNLLTEEEKEKYKQLFEDSN